MITVNDLIGLNYSNLRNPIALQSGINSTQPLSRSYNLSPDIDSNIYMIPSTMDQNNLTPIGETNTTGIAPLLKPNDQVSFGESVDNFQGFTDKVDFSTPRKKMDLSGLLQLVTNIAIPGSGLITRGLRGLKGLAGLNRRIQQSDFGQATSLADYLDMQRYGGAQGRIDAAARNMAQARGLQKQIDARTSSQRTSNDRGMGQMPTSTSASRSVGISAANQESIDPAGAAGKGRKG